MAESKKQTKQKKGFFRRVTSTFFDLPRWVSIGQYKNTNKVLYKNVREALRVAQPTREETFEQAMYRLGVSEDDLKVRLASNQRVFVILLAFIGFLSLYGFYLLFHGAISGTLVVLAVIGLSAVRAFQYSFWNFQIKHRRLGCSFQDWWQS
ncbi:MAG: type IVB secretion system protein IcmV [Gammaproteobacteria bacterium]|nr:type IVB secretion system protein IcmV [Gammaproteobacteria bacterium]